MNFQYIAVIIILAAAVAYTIVTLMKKRRSFSTKHGCADDCGCSGGSKKLPS